MPQPPITDVLALDLIAQKLRSFDRNVDAELELVGEIRQIEERIGRLTRGPHWRKKDA